MTPRRGDAPVDIVDRLRRICLALPEAEEQDAWVGVRWSVRGKAFAHVLTTEAAWPPVYVRAMDGLAPAAVLTFESAPPELDALRHAPPPFFAPPWRPTIVGMVLDALDDPVDWYEIAELLTESYCVHAPARLVELVDRPGAS